MMSKESRSPDGSCQVFKMNLLRDVLLDIGRSSYRTTSVHSKSL